MRTGFISSKPTELTERNCPWVYVFPFQDPSNEGTESHTPYPLSQLLQKFVHCGRSGCWLGTGGGSCELRQCNWAEGAPPVVSGGAEESLMGWVNLLKCVFYNTLPSLFHLTGVLFFFFFPLIPDMMNLGEELGMIAQITLGHVGPCHN